VTVVGGSSAMVERRRSTGRPSRTRRWPWPATLQAAAAEQCQDGTAGSGSHGDSKQGGEPGLRRDGGGGAAWPSHDWELERLEELEEARCGGGAAAAMELSPALAMRA